MMVNRQGPSRPRTSALLSMLSSSLLGAAPLAVMAMAPAALAQKAVKQLDPSYKVVSAATLNVRAGNNDAFYVVSELKAGDVVVVDGEDSFWSRVVYGPSWPAFVSAGEGSYDTATQTFTLSKPSVLLAFSVKNPQYCWQALLDDKKPVASGTKLKVQSEIKDATGAVKGYKVNAPEGARGFVDSRGLRAATAAETDAYKAKMGLAPVTPVHTPAPATTPPATNPATPSTPSSDKSLVDPIVKPTAESTPTPAPAQPTTTPTPPTSPTTTPTTTPAATPTGEQPSVITQQSDPNAKPAEGTPAATPTATPTDPATPAAPVKDPKTASLEQLEAAFQKVNSKDADMFTAEYDSLLAEINKTIGELSDGPVDVQRKKQLQLRADVLKLRIGVRDSLKRSEEAKRALNTDIRKTSDVLAEAAKTRVYSLMGTLAASSIYDGKNLPLMYRLISADAKAPVTLGYINPDQDPTLASKVGQVVGVVGDAILDPTLKISVIRPVRVDVIGASAESQALPTMAPAAPRPASAEPAKPATPGTTPGTTPAPEMKSPAATPAATPAKPVDIVK